MPFWMSGKAKSNLILVIQTSLKSQYKVAKIKQGISVVSHDGKCYILILYIWTDCWQQSEYHLSLHLSERSVDENRCTNYLMPSGFNEGIPAALCIARVALIIIRVFMKSLCQRIIDTITCYLWARLSSKIWLAPVPMMTRVQAATRHHLAVS